MRTINYAIFDMDGVLMMSSGVHERAFSETFEAYGIDLQYPDYAGMKTSQAIEAIDETFGLKLDDETKRTLRRHKQRLAATYLRENAEIAIGSGALLKSLADELKALGLASSASRNNVNYYLEKSGAKSWFKAVITGDDVRVAKPDPEIYRLALAAIDAIPEETVIVEDAINGLQAARAAGAGMIVGITGTHTASELKRERPDVVIERLEELRSLLS